MAHGEPMYMRNMTQRVLWRTLVNLVSIYKSDSAVGPAQSTNISESAMHITQTINVVILFGCLFLNVKNEHTSAGIANKG